MTLKYGPTMYMQNDDADSDESDVSSDEEEGTEAICPRDNASLALIPVLILGCRTCPHTKWRVCGSFVGCNSGTNPPRPQLGSLVHTGWYGTNHDEDVSCLVLTHRCRRMP